MNSRINRKYPNKVKDEALLSSRMQNEYNVDNEFDNVLFQ